MHVSVWETEPVCAVLACQKENHIKAVISMPVGVWEPSLYVLYLPVKKKTTSKLWCPLSMPVGVWEPSLYVLYLPVNKKTTSKLWFPCLYVNEKPSLYVLYLPVKKETTSKLSCDFHACLCMRYIGCMCCTGHSKRKPLQSCYFHACLCMRNRGCMCCSFLPKRKPLYSMAGWTVLACLYINSRAFCTVFACQNSKTSAKLLPMYEYSMYEKLCLSIGNLCQGVLFFPAFASITVSSVVYFPVKTEKPLPSCAFIACLCLKSCPSVLYICLSIPENLCQAVVSMLACAWVAVPSVLYLPVNTGKPLPSCAVIACQCLNSRPFCGVLACQSTNDSANVHYPCRYIR